jgi:hypothetical protein
LEAALVLLEFSSPSRRIFYRLPFTHPSLVCRIGPSLVQSERYLQGIRRYHDRNVKERSFNVGDLVLRRIQNTEGLHNLSSPWEGPFTVAKVTGPGSYRLQTLEGEDVSNSWNIDQLFRFYA